MVDPKLPTKGHPHCQGCRYLQRCGGNYTCDYMILTGMRRPCAFGDGCTVRETKKRGRKKKTA